MNKAVLIFSFVCLLMVSAQAANIPEVKVLQDRSSSVTLELRLNGYDSETVDVNGVSCFRVSLPGEVTYLQSGYPELPVINRSIIIPDNGQMGYRVLTLEYETQAVSTIVPSKGNIFRNVDPAAVPYVFGKVYEANGWWPREAVELSEPFIIRDYRGISIRFNPFQYNPVAGELRIAKRVVVEVYRQNDGGNNVLENRVGDNAEFADIYETVFLNFMQARYDSLSEGAGRMVIICADAYLSNMQPFKTWKRQKGIQTKMVAVSSIGNNATSIKNYIQNEYNAGGLVWVLLVGDGNQVVPAMGTVGEAYGADADPVYAYCAGGDYYPDIFVSRFSSRGTAANIDKQVSRSINYEKAPQASASWYHSGLGVASCLDGGSGYADSTRMNWLRDSLLTPKYYYTAVNKSYDYWGTSALIKQYIEAGTSIINYIGHGSTQGWSNGGGFSNGDINNLNNPWMLPFVISVACLVGNFNGNDCYCEVSVTAGDVAQPDGFLAHWGSSINQSWVPPCYGQEGAVNLLTHNKKNGFGGLCFNGASYMIEHYGPTNAEGVEMAQTWHIFGDASVQVRTNTPEAMTVDHEPFLFFPGASIFDVSVPGVRSALVGLYFDTLLVGSGYTDSLGNVTVNLNPAPSFPGTMYITVTAYNKIPYLDSVPVIENDVAEQEGSTGPGSEFGLQVYPSIARREVQIAYGFGQIASGMIRIYDASGRVVRSFAIGHEPSANSILWKGTDETGRLVPAGVYFVKLEAGDEYAVLKTVLLR